MQTHVLIIGAGPAGLTAAYLLAKENIPVTVLEADPVYLGGIAKTVQYKNYCFDIGGHRFFSKAAEIENLWSEILPNDMLDRPRSSRIFYRGNFFTYPLSAFEALQKLGLRESVLCVLSYLRAKIFPIKNPRNFAEWVSNHFGERLFRIFFKTYTEKVWGMRCEDISADWAAQRIKGLSLFSTILNAIKPKNAKQSKKQVIKTLINKFRYPRKGPGMLWDACGEKIKAAGGNIQLGSRVTACHYDEVHGWEIEYVDKDEHKKITGSHLISSAPLKELVLDYLKLAPMSAKQAAQQLQYRDFLIVVLILKDKNQFNDNWIYVHEQDVDVARIQNFKSWSEEMVPDANMNCYGLEYFCFQDDSLWSASDDILQQKAIREIVKLGLAQTDDIVDGCVVRQCKAYPVYNNNYAANVAVIREALEAKFPNLYLVGRNGMHKYNNQDHAMMTAMLTVKNILQEERVYDVWCVNQDAEYHESGTAGQKTTDFGLRSVPEPIR